MEKKKLTQKSIYNICVQRIFIDIYKTDNKFPFGYVYKHLYGVT